MPASRHAISASFLVLICIEAARGQGSVPVGEELQVNAETTTLLSAPSISKLTDGDFIIVWQDLDPNDANPPSFSLEGQLYDALGTPAGEQFQIVADTTGGRLAASVAALPGGFVVAWDSGDSLRAQLFTGDGLPLDDELQVDSQGAFVVGTPTVAALDGGGFAMAWLSAGAPGSDTSGAAVRGQVFATDGQTVGEQFQVNVYTSSNQTDPAIAALGDGFAVVWQSWGSSGSDDSGYSIQGRIFTASGLPLGDEFQVNTYTTGSQRYPVIGSLADGGFLAIWRSEGSSGSDDSGTSIQGQRFAADGSTSGPQFQVNSYTRGYQWPGSIAALPGGDFVVAWTSDGPGGPDSLYTSIVQARRFDAAGSPLAGDFLVNTDTEYGDSPSLAARADDGFMVVWNNREMFVSNYSFVNIGSRRFADPSFALVGLDGKCLDAEDAIAEDSTPISLYRCAVDQSQIWRMDLTELPQPIVGPGDKCLAPGPVDDDGKVLVVIDECDSADALWQLNTPSHAEPSLLIHADTGRCLAVQDAEDGTPVRLVECHGGASQLWRPAAEICTQDTFGTCLNSERFRIELSWRSFDGTTGAGKVVPVGSDDSGLLWFFEDDNWEMLIKVLDGCHINDRLWVFAAATTTVEYTLHVTDTATGEIREYFNPLGNAAAAVTDTDAFATCSSAETARGAPPVVKTLPTRSLPAQREGACVPSPSRLCLSDGRFSAEITWRDYAGSTGSGQVVGAGSPDSGLFWFFDGNNWEMLIKVLDACDVNGRFWMLAAATTDVEYTLRVTDTQTGITREYFNPLGNAADALVDTFEACP